MCGIGGFVDPAPNPRLSEFSELAGRMAETLIARGPDDSGVWVDQTHGVGLAHRRLSVVDLSSTGRQPMLSADGRFVLVYNGELYNFQELRTDLEARGHVFRGNSDSEVLVEACAAWGIDQTVRRCLGMFAFGVWDRQEHCLTLVRDRLGIKPLYWARCGQVFLFGSELKALCAHPCFDAQLDPQMLIPFLRYDYIPAPHSIYRGTYKLEPGCLLQMRPSHPPAISRYWDLNHVVQQGIETPLEADDEQFLDQLEALLSDAVQRRMVADVPVGAFLSGGIDSSTIVRPHATAEHTSDQDIYHWFSGSRGAMSPSMRGSSRTIWVRTTRHLLSRQARRQTSYRACLHGMMNPSPIRHRFRPALSHT